jgi:hemerythrin superfamily protein
MSSFCAAMKKHLKEEEELIPPIIREHYTQEEEQPILDKIGQMGGLRDLRTLIPAIKMAMDE